MAGFMIVPPKSNSMPPHPAMTRRKTMYLLALSTASLSVSQGNYTISSVRVRPFCCPPAARWSPHAGRKLGKRQGSRILAQGRGHDGHPFPGRRLAHVVRHRPAVADHDDLDAGQRDKKVLLLLFII